MELIVNKQPYKLFAKILERSLKLGHGFLDLGDFPLEPIRFEVDDSAAATGKLFITFYPSDSFLVFTSAALARDFDLLFIQDAHESLRDCVET